jgi:hypothetical protein
VCVKAGGAYVLVDAATKTIYELDDRQKPARFAEQKVKVTGTYKKAMTQFTSQTSNRVNKQSSTIQMKLGRVVSASR